MKLIGYLIVIFIGSIFFISMMEKWDNYQRKLKLNAEVAEITSINWKKQLPLHELIRAKNICVANDLKACGALERQLNDLAISVQTCLSKKNVLCDNFVALLKEHPILKILPAAKPVELPTSPFYWSLPTKTLQCLPERFEYRSAMLNLWWQKWSLKFYIGILLIITLMVIFTLNFLKTKKKEKISAENHVKHLKKIQLENQRKLDDEITKLETQKREKLNQEAETKKNLEKAQMEAEQKRKETIAKLEAQKKEAELMLQVIFKKKQSLSKTKNSK